MPDFTQMLLQKVAQLEEALTQKDKFIHSSRMIVKFREDHICRLEKKVKEGGGSLATTDSQTVIDQLKEEIKILRDQVQYISQLNTLTSHFCEYGEYLCHNKLLRNSNGIVCCENPDILLLSSDKHEGIMQLRAYCASSGGTSPKDDSIRSGKLHTQTGEPSTSFSWVSDEGWRGSGHDRCWAGWHVSEGCGVRK